MRVHGPPPPAGALLCPNHVSYLDVLALAQGLGCLFVAKAEVGRWPVCGALLRLAGHATVERASRRALPAAGAEVAARLRADRRVAVFLEGTTSPGERVLPFHPGLVQAALLAGAPLVPIALRYRPLDPRVSVGRDVAYWGDHVLVPHLLRLLGLPPLEVEVVCGEPLRPAPGADRKAVTGELERRVRALRQAGGPSPRSASARA